ncbi:YybS family protein [Neobacillus niacini]|uniref:YybS family protein n=1 Tax=Neobacillus niacini TaxID=86668 RepID=UPI00285AB116|nr:YybS family protein [Neobacillus niacini]MDR7000021.1 uncharacterized protein YybS (DUF2232 family) [Neobacillus niacini]
MKNARILTEGAILLAAFTVLLLLTIYVPLLAVIINFVLPLPFIMFTSKNHIKYTVAFFVAALFISLIAGSLMGLSIMMIYGTTGAVMGYLIQKNKGRTSILISGTLTFMIGSVILYVISVAFFQFDLFHELLKAYEQYTLQSQELLKSRMTGEQYEKIVTQNANMMDMLQVSAPSVLVMGSIFSVFAIQLICFPIAKRFGISTPTWGKFRELSMPRSLLWYYLIVLAANLLSHPQKGTYYYAALINLTYILELFMVLQGFAFLYFLFHQRNISKGIRVVITLLAFIPIFLSIIRILGIIDLGLDLRKRFEKKE